MWTLVLIILIFNTETKVLEPTVIASKSVKGMYEGFAARDVLGHQYTGVYGKFPAGGQAVCISNPVGEPT